jgi:hypothetical protein
MQMKWSEKSLAIVVGGGCVTLFTGLLIARLISPSHYIILVGIAVASGIVIAALPRVQELTFKLDELKLTLAQAEKTKAELVQMYGGIEHLKHAPLVLDNNKIAGLGLNPSYTPSDTGPMRHTIGCITRERQRVARILVSEKSQAQIAEAILDGSLDDQVFRWDGPDVPLDAPVKPAEQRRRERGAAF